MKKENVDSTTENKKLCCDDSPENSGTDGVHDEQQGMTVDENEILQVGWSETVNENVAAAVEVPTNSISVDVPELSSSIVVEPNLIEAHLVDVEAEQRREALLIQLTEQLRPTEVAQQVELVDTATEGSQENAASADGMPTTGTKCNTNGSRKTRNMAIAGVIIALIIVASIVSITQSMGNDDSSDTAVGYVLVQLQISSFNSGFF